MAGSKAKKPKKTAYHHGDLRRALVEEATRVVEREGHEAVKVREIARALSVSAAAPFRHFEDRTDLLRAVALEAERMACALSAEEAMRVGDDPLLRFRAEGLAFIRFALRHPRLFALRTLPEMHVAPRDATDDDRAFLEGQRAMTLDNIRAAQARGQVAPGDPALYELAGAALTYDLAHLYVDGFLPNEGVETLCENFSRSTRGW